MFDRCLFFNLNALARVVNKQWTKAFVEFDVSPAHGYLLRMVLSNPGITQKQLTHELKLEKSTITRFVDVLQKKDLIIRSALGEDGREINIFSTVKSQKMLQSLEDKGNELYQKMIDIFGQEQLISLVDRLKLGEQAMRT